MRKMRINRFFTLFLSLVLLLSLAACGEKETVVENDPGKEIVQEESAKDPVVKEEPEKKEETPAEKAEESKPEKKSSAAKTSKKSAKKNEMVKTRKALWIFPKCFFVIMRMQDQMSEGSLHWVQIQIPLFRCLSW